MIGEPQPPPTPAGMSTNRLETFSDSVIAIVITLLVFELKVPDLPEPSQPWQLTRALWHLWPRFISCVISFVVIGIYWVTHHSLFQFIRRSDYLFLWLNMGFLLAVAFIPFPTSLLGQYWYRQSAVLFYGCSLALAGMALNALWWYATRNWRLVDADLSPLAVRVVTRKNLTAPAMYLAAVIVSFWTTTGALILFIVTPVLYLYPGRMREFIPAKVPAPAPPEDQDRPAA